MLRLEALEDRCVPTVLQVGAREPFPTISSALTTAKAGDTILVHEGTYQETVDIATKNITLKGVNLSAVIKAPTNRAANAYSIVQVNGVKGVTIRGLTIEGTYTGTFTPVGSANAQLGLHVGIYVSNGGSATILNNHITNIRAQARQ
jgi:hypothetical protein